MEVVLGRTGTIQSEGAFYGSASEGENALVDVQDIADVAATIISEGAAHAGKTYIVTGSEALSNSKLAATISQVAGREIKFVNLSTEELGKAYKSYGMNEWLVNALLELYNITRPSISSDVKVVTEKEPIRFRVIVEENIAAFTS